MVVKPEWDYIGQIDTTYEKVSPSPIGNVMYIHRKMKNVYESEKNRLSGIFSTSTGQGRINSKGDTIVPPIYLVAGNLSDRMYVVQDKSGKWGAYNDKGKLVIEPKFDEMYHFYEGLSNFKLNGKWGYVDKQGKIAIEPTFEYASHFTNGLAYAEINGKSGFINKKGVFVIAPTFDTNRGSRFQ